jgi:YVTN family beta-propeller protein
MRGVFRGFCVKIFLLIYSFSGQLNAVCNQAWVGDNFGDVVAINTQNQMQTALIMQLADLVNAIAITPDGSQAFNVDPSSGIYVVDTTTLVSTPISSIEGVSLVISPDGQSLFVPYLGSPFQCFILKIDAQTHASTVLNPLNPLAIDPAWIAISADGTKLYITGSAFGMDLLVVDSANGNLLQGASIGTQLDGIAVAPNGSFAYVADDSIGGTVYQVNTSSLAATPVNLGLFLPFQRPVQVAISPNNAFAYVSDESGSAVYVIDTSSNTVVARVTDPSIINPVGIAVTPDGTSVYVANFENPNVISVINTSTLAVSSIMTTGAPQPLSIAMAPACHQAVGNVKGVVARNSDIWQTDIFSDLCWTVAANFQPSEYVIYRNSLQVGSVSGDQTHFEDHYLKKDKTYEYSIYAIDSQGNMFLIGNIDLET